MTDTNLIRQLTSSGQGETVLIQHAQIMLNGYRFTFFIQRAVKETMLNQATTIRITIQVIIKIKTPRLNAIGPTAQGKAILRHT